MSEEELVIPDDTQDEVETEQSMFDFEPPSSPMVAPGYRRIEYGSDAGELLEHLYEYYDTKGFTCVCIRLISEVIVAFSLVFFTFVILNHVNLDGLYSCKREECGAVSVFIRFNIFRDYFWYNWLIALVCLIFMGFVGYKVYINVSKISKMTTIKKLVNQYLQVSDAHLQTVTWGELCEKFLKYNDDSKTIRKQNFDALDMVNHIMRVDNYIIALENEGILNLRLPLVGERVLNETLIFSLRRIIGGCFDSRGMIKPEIFGRPEILKTQFVRFGMLNLIAAPFIFFYVLIKVLFKYFGEAKMSQMDFVMGRRWSTLTLWKFRCYNELPHEFRRRMGRSRKHAELYVKQFPSPLMSLIGKNLKFYSSAAAFIIILLTLFKNELMLHVTILGQNLLWWFVVCGAVFAAGSGMVIGKFDVFQPQKFLDRVCNHTQFMPEKWKNGGHEFEVFDEFRGYYQTTLKWFFYELSSIFVTPLLLIFSLADSSNSIMTYLNKCTTKTKNCGDVCGFGTFDFKKYGYFRYGGGGGGEVAPSAQGKMEKSFLNFKINHPNWQGDEEEKDVLGGKFLVRSLANCYKSSTGRTLDESVNLKRMRMTGKAKDFERMKKSRRKSKKRRKEEKKKEKEEREGEKEKKKEPEEEEEKQEEEIETLRETTEVYKISDDDVTDEEEDSDAEYFEVAEERDLTDDEKRMNSSIRAYEMLKTFVRQPNESLRRSMLESK